MKYKDAHEYHLAIVRARSIKELEEVVSSGIDYPRSVEGQAQKGEDALDIVRKFLRLSVGIEH